MPGTVRSTGRTKKTYSNLKKRVAAIPKELIVREYRDGVCRIRLTESLKRVRATTSQATLQFTCFLVSYHKKKGLLH